MTKAGLFYHDMRYLLKNKGVHIMVNDLHYSIPQVQDKKKGYTVRDIRKAYRARQFQHITGQPIKRILHAVDNNILQNLPILREDVRISEDIYGPSIPHLKGKTVRRMIQHVDTVKRKVFLKPPLISTRMSPISVTSCTSMELVPSTPYHGTSCLPQEV